MHHLYMKNLQIRKQLIFLTSLLCTSGLHCCNSTQNILIFNSSTSIVSWVFSVFNNNLGTCPCSIAGNSACHLPAMQGSTIFTQYVAGNNISCASVPACQSPPYIHLGSNNDT